MLFIQQLSVLFLFASAAFAAVIPKDQATKAANLKRVIADRQYKRSSIGKRTTASTPRTSAVYCSAVTGFLNSAGICVQKCDNSLANFIQNPLGGCQCASGFTQLSPVGPCVDICLTNFFRDSVTQQCGCDTTKFDLLSPGVCVSKCGTGFQRSGENCVAKCSFLSSTVSSVLYGQNSLGGCIGFAGAKCGAGVTCQSGLRCGAITGTCGSII